MGAKSTDQSYVFNMLNKDSKINGSIKAIIQNGKGVEPSQIEEQLMIISKRFKMPLKNKVLDYYKTGRIKLMTAPDPSKQLPSAMPFFLMKANGDVIAVVMVDIFGNVLQNGDISIDAKKLYVLMESAYMAIEYNTFANKYNTNGNILNHGAKIYANMFIKPINRKYNINVDRIKTQKVLFMAAKFYLVNIIGMDIRNEETINNIAKKAAKVNNPMLIDDAINDVNIMSYKDINTFVTTLANGNLNLGLEKMNIRGYLEAYMQMYGGPALLALELFPYFVFNIDSAIHGGFINNQYMFEDLIEKDGPALCNTLNNF